MKLIRAFFSAAPKYLLWLVMSTIFWLWIFTLVTNTTAEKKVTLYAEVPALEDPGLAAELEKAAPEYIKMVQAHSFDYFVFQTGKVKGGDIYLVPASNVEEYLPDFLPLDLTRLPEGLSLYESGGTAYGVRVYDAGSGEGAAKRYISYTLPGLEAEDYYLFFGVESLHSGEPDAAAYDVAAYLLELP